MRSRCSKPEADTVRRPLWDSFLPRSNAMAHSASSVTEATLIFTFKVIECSLLFHIVLSKTDYVLSLKTKPGHDNI